MGPKISSGAPMWECFYDKGRQTHQPLRRGPALCLPFPQVAGLISAIIVMIVTLAIGFLLEPLPKVKSGRTN